MIPKKSVAVSPQDLTKVGRIAGGADSLKSARLFRPIDPNQEESDARR